MIIPEKFRKEKNKLNEVLNFIIDKIPKDIKETIEERHGFEIICYSGKLASPYPLEIKSFLKDNSKKYISSKDELLKNLKFYEITFILKDKENIEIIGIDESKVEHALQGCAYAYLKSVAFRISKKGEKQEEALGPLVRDFNISFKDDAYFEKKNQFLGYLRNLFIAYIAIFNSIKNGYYPIVFIHGPLVRAIGGFTDIILKKDEAIKILSIDIETDDFENSNIILNGENILKKFHDTELEDYLLIYETLIEKINTGKFHGCSLWKEALPIKVDNEEEKTFNERKYYPGISIYFWLLGKLYDLCEKNKIPLIAVVENIERSTEFVQYVLPSLYIKNPDKIPKSIINLVDRRTYYSVINRLSHNTFRKKFYKYIFNMIHTLNITDSVVTTYLLNEGEYTTPIKTYRYMTRSHYEEIWGHTYYGIDDDYKSILEYYFNPEEKSVVFSYLRTTPLREPIRVEFFDIYGEDYHYVLGITYLMSLLYPNYGLPIILYYADKIARTHKNFLQNIVNYVICEILKSGGFSVEDILRINKNLSRNFLRRG